MVFFKFYLFIHFCIWENLEKKSRYPLVRYDVSVGEDLLSTKEPHF